MRKNKIAEAELVENFKAKLASLQEYRKKELAPSAISKHAEEKVNPEDFLLSENKAVDPVESSLDSSIESMADDSKVCESCKEKDCKCCKKCGKSGHAESECSDTLGPVVALDKKTKYVLSKLAKMNKQFHAKGATLAADVVEVTARKIYAKAKAKLEVRNNKIAALEKVAEQARLDGNHFASDLIHATINKIASHELETPDYEVPADWVAGTDLDLPEEPTEFTSFEEIEPPPFGSPENPLEIGDHGILEDSGEEASPDDVLNMAERLGKKIDDIPEYDDINILDSDGPVEIGTLEKMYKGMTDLEMQMAGFGNKPIRDNKYNWRF